MVNPTRNRDRRIVRFTVAPPLELHIIGDLDLAVEELHGSIGDGCRYGMARNRKGTAADIETGAIELPHTGATDLYGATGYRPEHRHWRVRDRQAHLASSCVKLQGHRQVEGLE